MGEFFLEIRSLLVNEDWGKAINLIANVATIGTLLFVLFKWRSDRAINYARELEQARSISERDKKRYTFQLLDHKFSDRSVFSAYKYVSDLIARGKQYDPELIPKDRKDEIGESVEKLLSYFEMLASAYLADLVDRKIVKDQLKSGLKFTYLHCYAYIRERQDALQRYGLYENLRTLSLDHLELSLEDLDAVVPPREVEQSEPEDDKPLVYEALWAQ